MGHAGLRVGVLRAGVSERRRPKTRLWLDFLFGMHGVCCSPATPAAVGDCQSIEILRADCHGMAFALVPISPGYARRTDAGVYKPEVRTRCPAKPSRHCGEASRCRSRPGWTAACAWGGAESRLPRHGTRAVPCGPNSRGWTSPSRPKPGSGPIHAAEESTPARSSVPSLRRT